MKNYCFLCKKEIDSERGNLCKDHMKDVGTVTFDIRNGETVAYIAKKGKPRGKIWKKPSP